MFADFDWCNIYHVCIGNRDNIFLCPPGTIFNDSKQGCMDRYDGTNCNRTRSYYKPPLNRQERIDPPPMPVRHPPVEQRFAGFKHLPVNSYNQRASYPWRKPHRPRQVRLGGLIETSRCERTSLQYADDEDNTNNNDDDNDNNNNNDSFRWRQARDY